MCKVNGVCMFKLDENYLIKGDNLEVMKNYYLTIKIKLNVFTLIHLIIQDRNHLITMIILVR